MFVRCGFTIKELDRIVALPFFTIQELDCIGALSFFKMFPYLCHDFELSKQDNHVKLSGNQVLLGALGRV